MFALLLPGVRRARARRYARADEDEEDFVHAWNSRYEAVPSDDLQTLRTALRGSPGYSAIVRRLLAAASGAPADGAASDAASPEVEGAVQVLDWIAPWDDKIARWILEMVRGERGCEAHAAVAAVVGAPRGDFLADHHAFVGELLGAMDRCPPEAQAVVRRALFATAYRGRVGLASEVDLDLGRLRERAAAIAAAADDTPAGRVKRAFYRDVVDHAETALGAERDAGPTRARPGARRGGPARSGS